MVDGVSGGEGRRGRGVKRDYNRARMPEAERTVKTGSVFSGRDDVSD